MLELHDHAGLTPAERRDLVRSVVGLTTLAQVIRWGLSRSPARMVEDVIIQDEYSHDVLIGWDAGRYLVFDTT
ncbi:MAG: hypothetical protein AAGC55_14910 [Myxococcota bacterium]